MSKKTIPDDVKKQVDEIVENFNKQPSNKKRPYQTRYKGNFLYLDRTDYGRTGAICRLKYNGAMVDWDFAIYKYSDNGYDPGEFLFPGSEHVDGTVEGAMQAGLKAYS